MRKMGMIAALGTTLLLGLTLSASALTIDNAPGGELDLYKIVNYFLTFGGSYTSPLTSNADLLSTYAPVLETLPLPTPGGTQKYALTGYYATYAAFTQNPGTYPAGGGSIASIGSPFPTSSLDQNAIVPLASPIYFTPTTDPAGNFGFADTTSCGEIKYTEQSLNPGSPSQSNGLIFQVSFTQFIVAFEDGDGTQPLGDSDYNDLVLNVTWTFEPIPLPPPALLLGSGLLAMVGLGWRRRKS